MYYPEINPSVYVVEMYDPKYEGEAPPDIEIFNSFEKAVERACKFAEKHFRGWYEFNEEEVQEELKVVRETGDYDFLVATKRFEIK